LLAYPDLMCFNILKIRTNISKVRNIIKYINESSYYFFEIGDYWFKDIDNNDMLYLSAEYSLPIITFLKSFGFKKEKQHHLYGKDNIREVYAFKLNSKDTRKYIEVQLVNNIEIKLNAARAIKNEQIEICNLLREKQFIIWRYYETISEK